MSRVVITGVGVACAFGGWDSFRKSIADGVSGTGAIRLPDVNGSRSRVACQTGDELLDSAENTRGSKLYSRVVRHAIVAAKEAFFTSGLDPSDFDDDNAMAVYIGSGGGGIDVQENQYKVFFANNGKKVSPFAVPVSLVGMVSSEVSTRFGLSGPSQVISTGCTSSTDAIGQASLMIKNGVISKALAGGADACITPGIIKAFDRMGVISRGFNDTPDKSSRPFSADRDGFVLGEGAWMFVLEKEEDAKKRGATIFAEIMGWSANCEVGGHQVRMKEDGIWPARAIGDALANSNINTDEVSYIALHGTGTKLNDAVETRAIKIAFGAKAKKIPGSSIKSMLGHPQGASGAMAIAGSIAGMIDGFIPPTINLFTPDPECDLDYVPNVARNAKIDTVVCNCMGFGARNSALVIKKYV